MSTEHRVVRHAEINHTESMTSGDEGIVAL